MCMIAGASLQFPGLTTTIGFASRPAKWPASSSVCDLGSCPTPQGSLRDSASLRVLARLRRPLTRLAHCCLCRAPSPDVDTWIYSSFVRDLCASGRKTAVVLGTERLKHLSSEQDFFSNVLFGGIPLFDSARFGFESRGAHSKFPARYPFRRLELRVSGCQVWVSTQIP
jgi:hypothetical protein